MNKANDPHPVTIILRDWSRTNKGNAPVAETHTKTEKKGDSHVEHRN